MIADWCVMLGVNPRLMCSGPEKTKIRSSSRTRILDVELQVSSNIFTKYIKISKYQIDNNRKFTFSLNFWWLFNHETWFTFNN